METTEHTKKLVSSLQDILQKNYDAEEGYRQVMLKAERPQLKKWLQGKAVERSTFATEIDSELRKLGAEPRESGSFQGDAHRVWIDIKTALSSNKDESILEECIRGEKASVDEYKEQLNAPYMAGSIVPVLTKQRSTVEQSLLAVKRLEDLVD